MNTQSEEHNSLRVSSSLPHVPLNEPHHLGATFFCPKPLLDSIGRMWAVTDPYSAPGASGQGTRVKCLPCGGQHSLGQPMSCSNLRLDPTEGMGSAAPSHLGAVGCCDTGENTCNINTITPTTGPESAGYTKPLSWLPGPWPACYGPSEDLHCASQSSRPHGRDPRAGICTHTTVQPRWVGTELPATTPVITDPRVGGEGFPIPGSSAGSEPHRHQHL